MTKTKITITLHVEKRRAICWVAAAVGRHLADKNYVNDIEMRVGDEPARHPYQIEWGMTDDEFAAWTEKNRLQLERAARWNDHCVKVHGRKHELMAGGMPEAEAFAAAKAEFDHETVVAEVGAGR